MGNSSETLTEFYNRVWYKNADERGLQYPFMGSPLPVIFVIISYLYFVNYGGRKFMQNRKPYDLKKMLAYFNGFQTVFNGLLGLRGVYFFINLPSRTCIELATEQTDFATLGTFEFGFGFFLMKFIDLSDTVFMILRKNYHQVSFLHVYHHTGMAIGSWLALRYAPGGQPFFLCIINSFVHSIMYFYYFLTAKYPEMKKSFWWKRYLTQIQMLQFAAAFFHFSLVLINPFCKQSRFLMLIYMSQTLTMTYMFAKFYYRAYIAPKKKNTHMFTSKKKVE